MRNRTKDAITMTETAELIELEERLSEERELPAEIQSALRADIADELTRRLKEGGRPAAEMGRLSRWITGSDPVRAGENVR